MNNSRSNKRVTLFKTKLCTDVPTVTTDYDDDHTVEFTWTPGYAAAAPEMSKDSGNASSSNDGQHFVLFVHAEPPCAVESEPALGT